MTRAFLLSGGLYLGFLSCIFLFLWIFLFLLIFLYYWVMIYLFLKLPMHTTWWEIKYTIQLDTKCYCVVSYITSYFDRYWSYFLLGICRPSLEWNKLGEQLLLADYARMREWGANVVRISLKYACLWERGGNVLTDLCMQPRLLVFRKRLQGYCC